MKIYLTSIYVANQDKALKFYTEILGFIKKNEIPLGDHKWLTVVAPEGSNDVELLLEPNVNSAAQNYQKSLFEQGIPAASFEVGDLEQEFDHLKTQDVKFTIEPTKMDTFSLAVFDDTCGNLIQIVQIHK